MAKPGDYACQRVDEVCIAADRLLVAMEDGGVLLSGYSEQLLRAKRLIDRALEMHHARIEAEDRQCIIPRAA